MLLSQSLGGGEHYNSSDLVGFVRVKTYTSYSRFLLKYISRDEVEILGRGNGGIVDIRNSIAAYEEASPLFGFLRYRRRNVLIKYVPEGCSRLVQGTNIFNSEKFRI